MRTWKKVLGLLVVLTMFVTALTFVSIAAEPEVGGNTGEVYESPDVPGGQFPELVVTGPDGTELVGPIAMHIPYGEDPETYARDALTVSVRYKGEVTTITNYDFDNSSWNNARTSDNEHFDIGSTWNAVLMVTYEDPIATLIRSITLTVVPRNLTVAVKDQEIVYGRSYATSGAEVVSVSNLLQGHEFTASVTADGVDVSEDGHTLSLNDDVKIEAGNGADVTKNYSFNAESTGTLTVTPRPITLVAKSSSKTFDGMPLTDARYALVDNATSDEVDADSIPDSDFSGDERRVLCDDTMLTATVSGSALYAGEEANVVETNFENKNFEIYTIDGKLTVTDRTDKYQITLTGASGEKVYDGEDFTVSGLAEASMKGATFASPELPTAGNGTVSFKLDVNGTTVTFNLSYEGISLTANEVGENDGEYVIEEEQKQAIVDAMRITVGENGQEDVKDQFEISFTSGTLTIDRRPVYVQATGSKGFGTTDSEFEVEYLPDPNEENADSGMVEGEEGDSLINYGTLSREPGEQIGEYAITSDLLTTPQEQGNYIVHFLPMQTGEDGQTSGSYFEITGDILWDVNWSVDIEAEEDQLDSHDTVMYVTVTPEEGQTLLPLSDFLANIKPSVTVDNWQNMEGIERQSYDTIDVSADDFADQDGRYVLTVNIPAVEYTAADPSGERSFTWTSGLQAGTTVTATMSIGDAGEVVSENQSTSVDVVPVPATLNFQFASGSNVVYTNENFNMIDEAGTVTVVASVGSEYIAGEDVIAITAGENVKYYTYAELQAGVLTRDELLTLTGAQDGVAAWCNTNPSAGLAISASLVDGVNHTAEPENAEVAFDTGAVPSDQTVGNRPGEASLSLELMDSVGALSSTAVTGAFGGSAPLVTMTDNGLVWSNVGDWRNYPTTLPHSGDVITVNFSDRVGHAVTHTINVIRSQAVTNLSLGVKPMENNTVPNDTLRFEGNANVWEELILTVDGLPYALDALNGNAVYDNSTGTWQYSIRLADIDGFPVGVPTTVTIAYADLAGGEASITITYKDHVDAPALGSELIVGSDVIWGFVEQGVTSVRIDIIRANGETEGVRLVALDAGYFCSQVLDTPLAAGDSVRIFVEDFCYNTESATFTVGEELGQAAAELLGASFTGEVGGEMLHRFATPIDMAALYAREDKMLTLPILAYKGIEIGTASVALTDEGMLEVSYEITHPDMLAQEAQARAGVYTEKPGFTQLIEQQDVVVGDLNAALSGTLLQLNVATVDYMTEEGYEGVVWLCAQFDIDMDEESYVNLGGRGVNFYRWLDEQRDEDDENGQSFELIGRNYSESSSYELNRTYYSLYHNFEHISANS